MSELFINLLNLSVTTGWLILAVMFVRILLKKAPKYIRCILWGLVGLRLICPVSVESVFSLLPSGKVIEPEIVYERTPSIHSGIIVLDHATNTIMAESFTPNISDSVNPLQVATYIAANLWIIGLAAMLVYCFVSYVLIKRKVFDAVKAEGNIYESDRIITPFVVGILRPRIYIPYNMDKEAKTYVIAHERAHIKRGDHIAKMIGFLILSVYWFNPLIWCAYILLCRDIELACDEKVLKNIGGQEKKQYSKVLLQYSVSPKMIAACPLAFGEVAVKNRIKNVLNYKKPAFWLIAVSIIICVVVAVCFMTNPKEDIQDGDPDTGIDTNVAEDEGTGDDVSDNSTFGKDAGQGKTPITPSATEDCLYLMLDDKLYYCTGIESNETKKCGVMDGIIETSVENWEVPTENNQSNFGTGYGWQRSGDYEVEVYIPYNGSENKWMRFVENGKIPGATAFDEACVLLDADSIFSITMVNGDTGEEIETSRLMSDNTMQDLLGDYKNLEFQPFEARTTEAELKVGWQYCLKLYDVNGNLLQTVTPGTDTITIKNAGEKQQVFDCSMNNTGHRLWDYMNLIFHPANGITGVYTVLDRVDSEGFSVSFRNTTDKTLQYGEAYTLWVESNGEWETVPVIAESWGFTDVAYSIKGQGSGGMSTYWTWLYGTLEDGKRYKLTLDLFECDKDGEWIKHTQEYEFFL